MEVKATHCPFFTLNRDFVPWILWCHELNFALDAMPTCFFPDCQQHRNRHTRMREPTCPVTYPPGHRAENRKGRWIENSPKPSPKELNKATELDKMAPLTFGPAVSALEAVTSWLCFCDAASGLWEKAGSQRPVPRAGRGAGECSLQDSQWEDGFRHIVQTPASLLFYYFFFCYLGEHEPFQGRDDTAETTCNIFLVTIP